MSVLITVTFDADLEKFRRSVEEHADELREVSARGREMGCLHHRFGIGENVVVAYDEWESAEAFEKFFSAPEMREFVVRMGASADTPPQINVSQAIATSDQF